MFRVVVQYQNGESLFFETSQFNTIEDLEQRFSDPPPWTFQTSQGTVTVEENVLEIYAQKYLHGRYKTVRRLELKQPEGPIITQGQGWVNIQEDKMGDEDQATQEPTVDTGTQDVEPEVKSPETPYPGPSTPTGTLVPYQRGEVQKFVSFRDTILKSRDNCDSWTQKIVEKQLEHEQLLADVHGILEERNAETRTFKQNIVGK